MIEILPYKIYSNKNLIFSKRKNFQPKLSLFIAFYNNISFLELVLASIESQSFKDFELVICDDGSNTKATDFIHKFMKNTDIFIKHIWHEDMGFRKNEMLNKGIKNCDSDYIVFIDQDCILHPQFLFEHYTHREKATILAGRRLELSPFISSLLSPDKVREGFIQKKIWWFLPLISLRKDNQGLKGVYLRKSWLRDFLNKKKRGVVGCNFSVHKEDLKSVNGFDMRYNGPGTGEDSDIEYRLNLNGIRTQSFQHSAVQYHLFHKLQKRANANEELFEAVRNERAKRTPVGLDLIAKGTWIDL